MQGVLKVNPLIVRLLRSLKKGTIRSLKSGAF